MIEEPSEMAALTSEMAELQREIREMHAKRTAAERAGAARQTVELALEAAERDRDALSSPEVEALRARAEDLIARLRTAWTSLDTLRVCAGHLDNAGVDLAEDPGLLRGATLIRLLKEDEARRDVARHQLSDIGLVAVQVPEPAYAGEPDPRRRQLLSEAMDRLLVEDPERGQQARKQRRSSPGTRDAGHHGAR
jgi:hypothetical protein